MRKKVVSCIVSVLSVVLLQPAICHASNLTDWQVAQNQVQVLTLQAEQYKALVATNPAFKPYLDNANAQLKAATKTANKLYPLAVKELQAMQAGAVAQPVQQKVSGSYILLPNGSAIKPGGSVPLAMLAGAQFVNGTGQNVMYAGIASRNPYKVAADPEANWAYEGSIAAGQLLPLAKYAAWMVDPGYAYLTIELRGTRDYEYSFRVTK